MSTLTVLFDLRNGFDLERGLGDDPEAALGPENHLVDVGPDGDTRSLQQKLSYLSLSLHCIRSGAHLGDLIIEVKA